MIEIILSGPVTKQFDHYQQLTDSGRVIDTVDLRGYREVRAEIDPRPDLPALLDATPERLLDTYGDDRNDWTPCALDDWSVTIEATAIDLAQSAVLTAESNVTSPIDVLDTWMGYENLDAPIEAAKVNLDRVRNTARSEHGGHRATTDGGIPASDQ